MNPRLPADLNILDVSAFGLAFHEEMGRADPKEAAVDVVERAMDRVRAFIVARDAARTGERVQSDPEPALRAPMRIRP